MGQFVISQSATGFVFALKAGNGETVATSEVYATRAAAEAGAKSVVRAAATAKSVDLTAGEQATNPRFEIYEDRAGQFRFRLRARNGQIVASSEGYRTKAACEKGVESVRNNAAQADV